MRRYAFDTKKEHELYKELCNHDYVYETTDNPRDVDTLDDVTFRLDDEIPSYEYEDFASEIEAIAEKYGFEVDWFDDWTFAVYI